MLVSPHRRTIQTAVTVLANHPQRLNGGLTLFIFPIAKEILNNGNDLPVSRDALYKFCSKIERENPGFKLDWTYMHALDKIIDHPNLWFLEIL